MVFPYLTTTFSKGESEDGHDDRLWNDFDRASSDAAGY